MCWKEEQYRQMISKAVKEETKLTHFKVDSTIVLEGPEYSGPKFWMMLDNSLIFTDTTHFYTTAVKGWNVENVTFNTICIVTAHTLMLSCSKYAETDLSRISLCQFWPAYSSDIWSLVIHILNMMCLKILRSTLKLWQRENKHVNNLKTSKSHYLILKLFCALENSQKRKTLLRV
jgi:hypothetical protein